MVDFFNMCLDVWEMFVGFLFDYQISGMPLGFIVMACIVFGLMAHYVLGVIK